MTTIEPTLLCRNENDVDREWMSHALKSRNLIKTYGYNNLNGIVLVKKLKGSSTNMEYIRNDPVVKNALMSACNNIQVDFPGDTMDLRRDHAMIKHATSMYLTGYFDVKGKSRLQIKGHDAWVVEMFVNQIKKNYINVLFPIYLFSEDIGVWCQLNYTFKWVHIKRPPKPSGLYVGLGSQPISTAARLEIELL